MSIETAAKAARIIETAENYTVLNDAMPANQSNDILIDTPFLSLEDYHFWRYFIGDPDLLWNRQITLKEMVITEWVARVPGLYWTKLAAHYRMVPDAQVEFRSKRFTTYKPSGKSRLVLGGIGDFVLPPDAEGKILMTITSSNNASTGIPVLIHPDIIKHHKIREGNVISLTNVMLRKMSAEWSSRFQTREKLKRGYLVVDHPDQVTAFEEIKPVEVHPCTIMEYHSNSAVLYDFVFCSIDTCYRNYRKKMITFFETYRKKQDRYGNYLLPADANDPLFDARYESKADLLRTEADGRSQLNLLVERIQNTFYNDGETIQSIMEKIPERFPNSQEIFALAAQLNIPASLLQTASAAKMSAQLVDICVQRKMLETLVDRLQQPF